MKKILALITLTLFSLPVFAFTAITSVEEAQQYCPATTGLTFVATNANVENGAGSITGYNIKNTKFTNFSPSPATRPKYVDGNGVIQDAQFREANGMYGYLTDNAITCFYTYTDFAGLHVALVERS